MFEVISEGNLIQPTNDSDNLGGFYMQGDNWKMFSDWNVSMANYIKSQYNGAIHLLSTSYAYLKKKEDNTFYHDVFDVMSSNIYDGKRPDNASFLMNFVNKKMLNEFNDSAYVYHQINNTVERKVKPLIFSETGLIDIVCEGLPANDSDFSNEIRMLYGLHFSGLAGGFSWNFWYQKEHYHHLAKIKNAIYNVPDLSSRGWYPGAMNSYPVSNGTNAWVYNQEYAQNMDGITNPSGENGGTRDRKVDLMYLRSPDKNLATGVISNKTFNFLSLQDCFDGNYEDNIILQDDEYRWDEVDPALLVAHTGFNAWDEIILLQGLRNNQRYYLNYYHPANLSSPLSSQDQNGATIRLACTMIDYVSVFEARRQGVPFKMPLQHDTISEINNLTTQNKILLTEDSISQKSIISKFRVYPNPVIEEFSIEISDEFIGSDIELFDIRGKLLKIIKLNNLIEQININNLSKGTYILKTQSSLIENKIIKIEKL